MYRNTIILIVLTAVVISTIAVVVNGVCAFFLMQKLLHVGLALALVISSSINFVLLLWQFRRKVGPIGGFKILKSIGKTTFASAVMGGVLIYAMQYIKIDSSWNIWKMAFTLILLVVGGALLYVSIVRVINPEEFRSLVALIRRKRVKISDPSGVTE